MKVGAVVQARVTSTRLPGKILKELPFGSGISVLEQVVQRLSRTKKLSDIVIATTTETDDDEVVDLAKRIKVKHFRGSQEDVLSRHYFAAKENRLDIVVRITSDCPCIDPEVVDLIVEEHLAEKADFTSSALQRTFPHGLDTEVLSFDVLEKAHFEATEGFEREHVCPYIYRSNPQAFKICGVQAPQKFYGPDIRVTLDTKEDYALLCAVFDYLYTQNRFFGAEHIISLFRNKPWLKAINKNVVQKKIFDSLQQEIEEAVSILDLQGLKKAREILARHVR